MVEGINFSEDPTVVDFRDAGRGDWLDVIEDEPYPDNSAFEIIRSTYSMV